MRKIIEKLGVGNVVMLLLVTVNTAGCFQKSQEASATFATWPFELPITLDGAVELTFSIAMDAEVLAWSVVDSRGSRISSKHLSGTPINNWYADQGAAFGDSRPGSGVIWASMRAGIENSQVVRVAAGTDGFIPWGIENQSETLLAVDKDHVLLRVGNATEQARLVLYNASSGQQEIVYRTQGSERLGPAAIENGHVVFSVVEGAARQPQEFRILERLEARTELRHITSGRDSVPTRIALSRYAIVWDEFGKGNSSLHVKTLDSVSTRDITNEFDIPGFSPAIFGSRMVFVGIIDGAKKCVMFDLGAEQLALLPMPPGATCGLPALNQRWWAAEIAYDGGTPRIALGRL